MVDLPGHGELMAEFLALPSPRMFMYGEQNSSLSYLTKLAAHGVELAKIPHSAHWPMYFNPVCDAGTHHRVSFAQQAGLTTCQGKLGGDRLASAPIRPLLQQQPGGRTARSRNLGLRLAGVAGVAEVTATRAAPSKTTTALRAE
jgi:hypothetical protein